MKTNFKFKHTYKGLFIALVALTSFSACTDDNEDLKADAFVRIVNASEGSAAQDFFLDSTKLNSSAVAYTQSSAYLTTTNGTKTGKFKTTGTATVNSSANINIDGGKYYTVYYTGGTSASSSFFATTDETVASSANKAKVRFINLSSAITTNIDVATAIGTKLVNNLAYKTASSYQEVDAATNFQLFAAGSTTSGISVTGLNLQAGKIYTVYISGSTSLSITYKVLVDKG